MFVSVAALIAPCVLAAIGIAAIGYRHMDRDRCVAGTRSHTEAATARAAHHSLIDQMPSMKLVMTLCDICTPLTRQPWARGELSERRSINLREVRCNTSLQRP